MTDSELTRLALASAPCGIAVCDHAGRILLVNPAFAALFAYAPCDLHGTSVDDLFSDSLLASALAEGPAGAAGAALPGGRSAEGRRKDLTRVEVEVGFARATYEELPIIVVSVREVTGRRTSDAQRELDREFDRLLAEIAARFLAVRPELLDDAIVESQRRLVQLLGVERSSLWQVGEDGDLVFTHIWSEDESSQPPIPKQLAASVHFPWVMSQLRAGRVVSFKSIDELASATDRQSFARFGTKSNATSPLIVDGQMVGALTFATVTHERAWPPYVLDRLQLVGTVFANSLEHRKDRQALELAHAKVKELSDQLAEENVHLRREVRTLKGPRVLSTDSPAAQGVVAQIEQVAPTTATVLLFGETGSGKEVFAEALHELSPRRQKPMVRVNCAAIPTALIESELFGRERGAYTGALSRQLGRFEIADNSTIFLDEVGELPLDVQVKLLRVLQDRVIERLGSPQQIKVNVRVVAATNRDLEQAVADRTFREDLYYRLNVFPIHVPPLRERVEDIPALVWAFVNEFSLAFGKNVESLAKGSLQALQAYSWPGNVRELRNAVERAMIVATGPVLVIEPPRPSQINSHRKSLKFVDMEVDHIRSVLEATGWRIRGRGGAADLLGIKPTTLESRMAKLGIVRSGRPADALHRGASRATPRQRPS